MNIYVRYFDHEDVFTSGEAVVNFLVNINDFKMTSQLENEVLCYSTGTMNFPKRIKVRNNVYFILIKTTANSLPEFKANRKTNDSPAPTNTASRKDERVDQLQEELVGWYKVTVNFKRMLLIPGTQKCQYRDTVFSAYVYATSGIDCYNQTIDHLKNRQDIDPRSQFPSEKRGNFTYTYIGDSIERGR